MIGRDANIRNNAQKQKLRLNRWKDTRSELWSIIEPLLKSKPNSHVLVVGCGNGDDLPLQRITNNCLSVDLMDIDSSALKRARKRLTGDNIRTVSCDVTDGLAELVLSAAAENTVYKLSDNITVTTTALGDKSYDLVIGDMLYTQLLHSGLIALGLSTPQQLAVMRAWDQKLCEQLVHRLHASVQSGGTVLHIHDVACWSSDYPQPYPLATVLQDPHLYWPKLVRQDACDPQLALERMRMKWTSYWYRWPFEPKKEFLVRATLVKDSTRRLQ